MAGPATRKTRVDWRLPCAQQGAALLIFLGAIVLLSTGILLSRLNAAVAPPAPSRDPGTVEALANAKEALISWAATHPDTPGLLPFPDRNDDGIPNYDGAADCVAAGAVVPTDLIGSFPILGESVASGCDADVPMSIGTQDTSGQRLWYAVSQNLVRNGGGGLVNPDIGELGVHPWISIRDQSGVVINSRVAAIIIAPGPPLTGQDRSGGAPAATNYLDSFVVGPTTYNNADSDGCPDALTAPCVVPPGEEFIILPSSSASANFNDRAVFITVDELMGAVQDRVLGDAALTLKSYRDGLPVTTAFYPWLSPFSDPRSTQGIATAASAGTTLEDSTLVTTFDTAGVLDGYLVRNLTDGSIGPVALAGVTPNTLTVEGLIGGATNTFAPGDRYVVHAPNKFQGSAGTVDGMLPLHYPNEVFQTGFTVNWNYSGEKNDDVGGDPSLQPTVAEVDGGGFGDLIVPETQGACKWTQSNRVDCRGWAFLPGAGTGGSNRTVEVWFNFTASTTTIVAPTGTDVRRRNHTYSGTNYGWVTALAAPDLPQETWTIRITDDDGILTPGWRLAVRDLDTDLVISKFEGIRYEIDVPNELPGWFVENNWHHYIYAAISDDAVGGGDADNDCTTPANSCLTVQLAGAPVRNDVDAVVVSPGTMLTAQDRDTATTLCPGQAPPKPAVFCDYFESPNSDDESPGSNLIFGRTPINIFSVTAAFNDHVRPVPP
jgi:hypothetical protein